MNKRVLDGRIGLVTGASRGIGQAISLKLACSGVKLGLVARSRDELADTRDDIVSTGGTATVISADLLDPESPEQIINKLIDEYGRLDFLINNAGIAHGMPLEETTLEEWDLHMNLNARAPFLLTRAALPFLRKSDGAAIINIASVVGRKGYTNQGAYTASKHALRGFSKVLARELHQEDIRVHVVSPGGVNTEMMKEMIEGVRPELDSGDLMDPAEIADIVHFLLTRSGTAVIDEINVRRSLSTPWK